MNSRGKHPKAFTLLEVMVALAILAMSLAAITFANNTSMLQLAATNRMIEASFLLEGVVEDIQAYYESKGFPTNSLEDRECELPPDMADDFECRYDLEAIELTPDAVTALAQAGTESLMGALQGQGGMPGAGMPGAGMPGTGANPMDLLNNPMAAGQQGKENPEKSAKQRKKSIQDRLQNANLSKLALLAPLFGPQGQEIMAMCGVNMNAIVMGLGGMMSFLPMVVQKVSERVRKLTVHLTWKVGPKEGKELTIETFIVSLPEEEVQRMKEAQQMQEAGQEMMQQMGPRSSAPRFNMPKGVPHGK